ncbi:hypothetical protein BMR1_03g04020 [Babesia microti strain RI]|uniref:Uncharacterized protein n=1 Tax=Babesia microti (strain RI) TaxID=1133968 RepID=A0A0K3ANX2_BABMR|nr:hypothetical protein BMR1_03g04020 [Babesia microti strain RI]CTQ41404.1 hypothetical protein BMR1_03g04020 [Babesia microti strain RI]|eukprot:XP_012649415.1 hypothetical protein BMR1_03g04020 [Babesia microti strain RI]
MDEDYFTIDISGHEYNSNFKSDSDSSYSLSSESLTSQPIQDNDPCKIDEVKLNEDVITLNHNFTSDDDDFIKHLRNHIYNSIGSETFCQTSHFSGNNYCITFCKNGLTNKLNEMSFLLRNNCGKSYPRILRYKKVPLSKHITQCAKRYYTNIPDLTTSKNCPEPIMDFTHCLSSLYLLPKEMCTGCGRRDCRKTWHSNKLCDFYPCDNCGQLKHHKCRHLHELTSRRSQKIPDLPSNFRDYLASSLKCLICGRIGHANCATNTTIVSNSNSQCINAAQKFINKQRNHYGDNKNYHKQKPHHTPTNKR